MSGKEIFDILVNWFPMLLLIGVWVYYCIWMRSGPLTKYQADCLELTRRQVECLERIAVTLEKNSK